MYRILGDIVFVWYKDAVSVNVNSTQGQHKLECAATLNAAAIGNITDKTILTGVSVLHA